MAIHTHAGVPTHGFCRNQQKGIYSKFANSYKMGLKSLNLEVEQHLECERIRKDRRWINYVLVKNMNSVGKNMASAGMNML